MTATLTTVNAIMKEVYEGTINDQLQSEAMTLKRIEKISDGVVSTVGGKYVTFPIRKTRNHGSSYRAEGAQLAAAGRQGYTAATENLKYGYQRLRMTGQAMALAESNYQAFASALDREVEGAKSDILRDQNRIVYSNPASLAAGATGVIAAVTATSTGTSITVGDTSLIEPGMVIDIVNAGTPVSGGTARTVVSITSATVFVVDSAVAGTTNGNHVTRNGNWNQEPNGLCQIVDDAGTLHGINSSTETIWKSVEDSSTTTLTELSMIALCDNVYRQSGKKVTAVFTSLGVRRSYFNLMTSLRRYNEPKEFSGGLIGLSFNYGTEIPVVADIDCPTKHMFFLNEGEIKLFRDKPWYFEDTDGSVWKWVHDYDMFEALMKCYWQLGTHQRNAHGKMSNITES